MIVKFGKFENGELVLAKSTEYIDGRYVSNPSVAMLRKARFKRVRDERPKSTPLKGWHWEQDGWHDGKEVIVAKWKLVKDENPMLADFDAAMEDHLRAEREARGYTTREPDVYRDSEVPRWAQDARDWIAHRDAVMLYAQELMNEVAAGTRRPPTMEEFVAGLPRIEWTVNDGPGEEEGE